MHDIEELARISIDHGFKLHEEAGPGLLESAYEVFLAASLRGAGLIVQQQQPVSVTWQGNVVKDAFRVDILVERQLIIEVKSTERFAPVHAKQLLTYLRLSGAPVGLLMNFGGGLFRDGLKRVINDRHKHQGNFGSSGLRVKL